MSATIEDFGDSHDTTLALQAENTVMARAHRIATERAEQCLKAVHDTSLTMAVRGNAWYSHEQYERIALELAGMGFAS